MNLFAEVNIQKHEASFPRLLLQMLEQSLRYLQQIQLLSSDNENNPSFSFKTERRLVSEETNISHSFHRFTAHILLTFSFLWPAYFSRVIPV